MIRWNRTIIDVDAGCMATVADPRQGHIKVHDALYGFAEYRTESFVLDKIDYYLGGEM
jgi:uncharacterized protein involved in tellurium resistance